MIANKIIILKFTWYTPSREVIEISKYPSKKNLIIILKKSIRSKNCMILVILEIKTKYYLWHLKINFKNSNNIEKPRMATR